MSFEQIFIISICIIIIDYILKLLLLLNNINNTNINILYLIKSHNFVAAALRYKQHITTILQKHTISDIYM